MHCTKQHAYRLVLCLSIFPPYLVFKRLHGAAHESTQRSDNHHILTGSKELFKYDRLRGAYLHNKQQTQRRLRKVISQEANSRLLFRLNGAEILSSLKGVNHFMYRQSQRSRLLTERTQRSLFSYLLKTTSLKCNRGLC
jgi:hypothetical protein